MTERENTLLSELCETTRETSQNVVEMKIALAEHIAAEQASENACRDVVHRLTADVFGVDGDPARPGLKGRMLNVEGVCRRVEQKYKQGLSMSWAVVMLCIGAVLTWASRHYFP